MPWTPLKPNEKTPKVTITVSAPISLLDLSIVNLLPS